MPDRLPSHRPLHILLASNGLPLRALTSSYSQQCSYLIRMFLELGHRVTMVCWGLPCQPQWSQEQRTRTMNFEDLCNRLGDVALQPGETMEFPLCHDPRLRFRHSCYDRFPCMVNIRGINQILSEVGADVLFMLNDLTILNPRDPDVFDRPAVYWVPIRYTPPADSHQMILRRFTHVIAQCPTAGAMIKKVLSSHQSHSVVPYVLECAADDRVTDALRLQCRTEHRLPHDAFIIYCNGNNLEMSNRNSLDLAILTFYKLYHGWLKTGSVVSPRRPFLWVRSRLPTVGNEYTVYDPETLLRQLDMPDECFRITCNRVVDVRRLLWAADVVLCASKGDSFDSMGVQAQALGIPLVTTRYMGGADYCWHGVSVPPLHPMINAYEGNAWWVMPDVDGLARALSKVALTLTQRTEQSGPTSEEKQEQRQQQEQQEQRQQQEQQEQRQQQAKQQAHSTEADVNEQLNSTDSAKRAREYVQTHMSLSAVQEQIHSVLVTYCS